MQAPQGSASFVNELRRKRLVNAILLIYALLIFDGAFRKWFLPMLSTPIFFAKDLIVLYCYYFATRYQLWPRNRLFIAALALIALDTFLALVQVILGLQHPIGAAYGLRIYFLLVPLTFLIAHNFRGPDLQRFVRQTMLIGIGMAVLVFFQYRSPINHPINKLLDADSAAFSYGDLARASGTFSFTQGHILFSACLLPMVATCWSMPLTKRPLRKWPLIIATIAMMINVALNGNRAIFVYCAYTLIASAAHKFLSGKLRGRDFAPEAVLLLGALLYCTLFSSALENMKSRVETANNSEDPIARALNTIDLVRVMSRPNWQLGAGIGAGIPATAGYRGRLGTVVEAEDDLPRLVAEGGLLGLVFVAYRAALAASILVRSMLCSKNGGMPLALLLASFTVPTLLIGQLSLNGTAHYFGWFFAGISIAATKLGLKTSSKK